MSLEAQWAASSLGFMVYLVRVVVVGACVAAWVEVFYAVCAVL